MTLVERNIKKLIKKVNRSLKHTGHKLAIDWRSDFVDLKVVNSNNAYEIVRIYSDASYFIINGIFTYIQSNINDCIFTEIED